MENYIIDRYPKKPCKFCHDPKPNHYPYACRENPKNKNSFSSITAKPQKPLKRSRLNPIGKVTQKWLDTRQEWIAENPPPIQGKYWECYLQIHPWCPRWLALAKDIDDDADHSVGLLTVDHVVSRSHDYSRRFDKTNLKPACEYCNDMKGSQELEKVKPAAN